MAREPFHSVPYPGNAVAKHHDLHRRLPDAALWVAGAAFNRGTSALPPGRRQRRWKRLVGARAGEPFQGDREVAQPVAGGGMAAAQLQELALHARIRVEQRANLVAGAL